MLKDEPEDLTHLAPTAGDVCVSLEDPPFLSDMLDEFILNSNYCPLLSPELPPAEKEAADSIIAQASASVSDPFIYRESPSSRASFSNDLARSPDNCSASDSPDNPMQSGGPGSPAPGLSDDEMLMLNISDVMADEELALRAPYIPMSDQDEALQLLISDEMVMWGPSQPDTKATVAQLPSQEPTLQIPTSTQMQSSLAQLLTNPTSTLSTAPLLSSPRKKLNKAEMLVNPAQVLGQISRKGKR